MAFDFYEIELKESLRPAITYEINSLTDPNARKSDLSKTITLPSSKELDKLFNHIFEINVETNTFNANRRLDVEYIADEESQLKGYLKLNEVVILDNNDVEYRCTIFGKNGDLFSKIGENELTDLTGLDTYNHAWTQANIDNSWDTSVIENGSPIAFAKGTGYVYPLIENGFNDFDRTRWKIEHMFPAIYAKEYIDRIFTDAGKSYTSTFFNSTTFKSLVIPFNGTDILKTAAQLDDELFKADTVTKTVGLSWGDLVFTNEVLDTGGVYNNATGVFTAADAGYYDFTCVIDAKAEYTPSGNSVDVYLNRFVDVELALNVNGTRVAFSHFYLGDETQAIAPAATYDTGTNVAYPSDAHSTYISTQNTGGVWSVGSKLDEKKLNPASNLRLVKVQVLLAANDTVKMQVKYNTNKFIDPSSGRYTDGAGTFFSGSEVVTVTSGKFLNNVTKADVVEGGTIDMYTVVPKDIKQKDFLRSICNMFRLEIQPDPSNEDNYIIEPAYSTGTPFYNSTSLDWSEKLDVSQELIFEPMGLLNASEYLYKYKDDKDKFNEDYISKYEETYGQRSGLIDNDFVKEITTTELVFSPTPSVKVEGVDLIVPTIIKNQDTYRQTESNIRILYYKGLLTTSTVWTLEENDGTQYNYTSYPYSGHFNDPYDPTLDINFGLPKELYYDNEFQDINVTNNNLFNLYHLPFLKQISQRDSKLISGWFYLKPSDIASLSFRPQYFFNNSYHRLIRIENYDPNNPVTKCYFLKVNYTTPLTSTTAWVNAGKADIDSGFSDGVEITEALPSLNTAKLSSNNIAPTTADVSGKDNYVDMTAKSAIVYGDGNYIAPYTTEIVLLNSNNNIIESGVSNVTLIGSSDLTIDESNVTYINGVKQKDDSGDLVKGKSADFDADNSCLLYEVTTSSGDVTATIYTSLFNEGDIISFKKMTAANKMILVPDGGTIDQQTSLTITAQYTTIRVMYDSKDFVII